MRGWYRFAIPLVLLVSSCGQPSPALRSGDGVQLEIAFAPKAPWHPGDRVALGLLLQVHRPGRPGLVYLGEREVADDQAAMQATITFFDGESVLDTPLMVPFIRDC